MYYIFNKKGIDFYMLSTFIESNPKIKEVKTIVTELSQKLVLDNLPKYKEPEKN